MVIAYANGPPCTQSRSSLAVSRPWPASSRARGRARCTCLQQLVARSPASHRTGLFHSTLCPVSFALDVTRRVMLRGFLGSFSTQLGSAFFIKSARDEGF